MSDGIRHFTQTDIENLKALREAAEAARKEYNFLIKDQKVQASMAPSGAEKSIELDEARIKQMEEAIRTTRENIVRMRATFDREANYKQQVEQAEKKSTEAYKAYIDYGGDARDINF